MQAPFFYIQCLQAADSTVVLDEENSRHAIQVLRLTKGDVVCLTDGKGQLATATITDDHRKHSSLQIDAFQAIPRAAKQVTVAISLLKNRNRFEWLLEKLTELGVTRIIPLLCARTEKESARMDRMEAVLVSALLQSRQVWMPELLSPVRFDAVEEWSALATSRFIAYCGEAAKEPLSKLVDSAAENLLIAIGPEGDFTEQEFNQALSFKFKGVSLGETRLRTETAGIVAASLLCLR